eukprot:SAG31_NODE_44753_length_261_cov_0.956790_1_plen_58_part_10
MLTRPKPDSARRFLPHPPAAPKQQLWHETGRQYQNRLHAELAADRKTGGSDGGSGSEV